MIKDANTVNLRPMILQLNVMLCLSWSRWMWSANVMFVNREDPQINYCRLKAYIIFTFLYSFRKSGKPQPIGTKVGIHIHRSRQGPTTFTKFWARSAKWGRNGGSKLSRRRSFFVSNTRWLFGNFATADFRQIWPRHVNRGWKLKRRFWTEIYETFLFRGHLPPKPQTWRGSDRYITQNRLQVKGCIAERYCLLEYSTL